MGSVMILCRFQSVACIARLHCEFVGPMGRPEDSAAESCIMPSFHIAHLYYSCPTWLGPESPEESSRSHSMTWHMQALHFWGRF